MSRLDRCRCCKIWPAADVSPHLDQGGAAALALAGASGSTAGAFVMSPVPPRPGQRAAAPRGDEVSVRSRSGWAPRRERTVTGRAVVSMGSRYVVINGQTVIDPRETRAWRQLVAIVVADEPLCWLSLPGCTGTSTTGDHVVPVSERPDLALVRDNVRGACRSCNYKRGNLPVEALEGIRGTADHAPRHDDALAIFAPRTARAEKIQAER